MGNWHSAATPETAEQRGYTALSLDVLTLDGARATEVTSFVTAYTRGPARDRFAADVLRRLGLPDRLATSAGERGPSRTK